MYEVLPESEIKERIEHAKNITQRFILGEITEEQRANMINAMHPETYQKRLRKK